MSEHIESGIGSFNITDQNPAAQRLTPLNDYTVRPLNDRVLVRRVGDPARESSCIVIPECARTPSKRGRVVAVGPGKRHPDGSRLPLAVQPGDLVEFGRYTDFDDGELALIQEADIVGVIE